ncbi:MAG TPA: cyclic nucleotide-binding domain-containing protein [Bauldia sp.]|nr:cyclic nucleotide-binding domain-containing protein [Bauldia sp.]
MTSILDHCAGADRRSFAPGAVLMQEGETSGRLYVLARGMVEVLRGDTQVAVVAEPGAVFGEMSCVLGTPHTATVRALTPATLFEFENPEEFLRSHPEIAFFLVRLLAQRLNAATGYLADIKRQFEHRSDHLSMVGEVLESLMHQQRQSFTPGSDREPDPRM